MAPRGPQAAARRRRRLLRRRGGRRRATARTGWSTTTPSCSRASPRRSARSAASRVDRDGDRRAYLLQTAEKGIAWLRLVADGRAGHGSMVNDDNAVTALAEAVARIGPHEWPMRADADGPRLLDGMSRRSPASQFDPRRPRAGARPSSARSARDSSAPRCATPPTRRSSTPATRPTSSRSRAEAMVDGRFLPGLRGRAAGDHRRAGRASTCDVETVHPGHRAARRPSTATSSTRWSPRCRPRTPAPRVLPYSLSGGTDNKSLRLLGIRGYGFAPLRLPADLDFAGDVPRRRRAGAGRVAAVRLRVLGGSCGPADRSAGARVRSPTR